MKVLLLAGEESGVLYAERLRRALPGCEFKTYQDHYKTSDLAVMGFWAVIKRLFFFLGVQRTMKRIIREWKPDVVVTIDYPGLNLKLAAYAKARGIPAVHLVCPQVWAWHQGRIPKVAAAVNRLLCFFPFEPALERIFMPPSSATRWWIFLRRSDKRVGRSVTAKGLVWLYCQVVEWVRSSGICRGSWMPWAC